MSTTKLIGAISLMIVVFMVVGVVGWGLQTVMLGPATVTTQIDSAGQVIEKTYDADNAIYNYEWFQQQYEDIHATKRVIKNTKIELDSYKEMYGDPKEWDWQTKQDYNSINTKYLGQKNHYESLVADYNARSEMANRNIFKDKLPLHVDKILW